MFGVDNFWLETRVIIKIESNPFNPINFDALLGDEAKKNILITRGPIPEILVKKLRIYGFENIKVFLSLPFCIFFCIF